MFKRMLESAALGSLADTRVVLIVGPRQAGKTTFLRQLSTRGRTYLSLDDAETLAAAKTDPVGFVRDLDVAAIDEVQRAPELLLAIKAAVDRDPRPGRFLLSGSANVMMLPTVADSLAGRIEIHTLLPLAQCETAGSTSTFLSDVFAGEKPTVRAAVYGDELVQRVLAGGYPEALSRQTTARRTQWYRSYIETIVQRDVGDVAAIADSRSIPRLLQALGEHASQLVNYSELGGRLGISHNTTHKYVTALELVYLLRTVEPYFRSTLKRLIKTPKVQFYDSGLLAALTTVDANAVKNDRKRLGPLLESFVFGELAKLATVYPGRVRIDHYRDRDANEIDFVLENAHHHLVGVEVKASATVTTRDFATLRRLADASGQHWSAGIVFYDGDKVLPFGPRMWAAPVSCLW